MLDLTEEQKNKVLHCIDYHEEYNCNNPKNKENDINVLVLQDADNLDGIGAIGMMRTILYSNTHGISMYDSSVPIEIRGNYIEGEHDEFMKEFVNEFLSEWNGEK